jgi:hypothetical protein
LWVLPSYAALWCPCVSAQELEFGKERQVKAVLMDHSRGRGPLIDGGSSRSRNPDLRNKNRDSGFLDIKDSLGGKNPKRKTNGELLAN